MMNRIITKSDECVKVFFAQCRDSVKKSEILIKSYRPTLLGKRFVTDAQLSEKLNISKHQISFVNNSNAGEGLLFYGNVIIPFADRYPQDTRTYALMSTKPDEIQT